MKSILKMTRRSIKTFFGRYMALLLIVALSAGFFAGLKLTTDAMIHTGDLFFSEQNLYDFRLMSTLGFTAEDVSAFAETDGVKDAEGCYSLDVLMRINGSSKPVKLMSMPEYVNLPSLTAGRMPENEHECLADDHIFSEDDIGTVLTVDADNPQNRSDMLSVTEYEIVGIVDSPLYINIDRGTTVIGTGALYTFLYIDPSCFTGDIYTEIDLTLQETESAYSDAYDALIDRYETAIEDALDTRADIRYHAILDDNHLTEELGEQFGIFPAETYLLTRNENAGYISFENDTSIIGGIANIFPVFFILIAMLVCSTTMTRMVDEERTQLGVLKAMGYSGCKIMTKYILYAGSATVLGWLLGFFVCTWGLPQIFWFAYRVLYDFSPMPYLFDPVLAILTLLVSLFFILGSTCLSCRRELASVPASLIRPRNAKSGKRVFLEYITPLWKRLTFLQKITMRNMLRYKTRMIMMLVGIGCCAGLVVTAFGVRDSMRYIGELQFETVQKYNIEASFDRGNEQEVGQVFEETEGIDAYMFAVSDRIQVYANEEAMSSVTLFVLSDPDSADDFFTFARDDETLSYPTGNQAMISFRLAEKLGLSDGDMLTVENSDHKEVLFSVSGVFDNYVSNYVFLTQEAYEAAFGESEPNIALLITDGDEEAICEKLIAEDAVTGVSMLSTSKNRVHDALSCLDYIITMVIAFSGALAFVVTFNLTNINLAERSREIATVEVLGFYPKETQDYVLRENLILSVLASFIGLPLGYLFHSIVMHRILIDAFAFDIHITIASYCIGFVCSVCFAFIVNLFMKHRIDRIPMAESLKAVE